MKNIGLIGIVLCCLGAGCSTTRGLQAVSSGQVGCAPSEIEVKDRKLLVHAETWTAVCNGTTFYCTEVFGGKSSSPQISCKERTERK